MAIFCERPTGSATTGAVMAIFSEAAVASSSAEADSGPAAWLGGVAFVVAIFLLYRWVERMARKTFA